jgi:hypothetical protein
VAGEVGGGAQDVYVLLSPLAFSTHNCLSCKLIRLNTSMTSTVSFLTDFSPKHLTCPKFRDKRVQIDTSSNDHMA